MIYVGIGLVAGVIIIFLRTRKRMRDTGQSTSIGHVTANMGAEVEQRKVERAQRKAALKAARYAKRHPKKAANGQSKI